MPKPHRLTIAETLDSEGYDNLEDWCRDHLLNDEAPACCSDYCTVEPDGTCPHGHPSLPLAAGLI